MLLETRWLLPLLAAALAVDGSCTASCGFQSRPIAQLLQAQEQGEGAGARVHRSIGRPELRSFDPFLMLDFFRVQPPAGFPDHPHRGFETVTFMLPSTKGAFAHEDFCGHSGIIRGGDLQWMTAGRGIVHAEMPHNDELAEGLQLWVNLKAADKMCEPAYQELPAASVPVVTRGGITARVIAGAALGTESPVYTRTPVHYAHFEMQPGEALEHPVPEGWNALAFVIAGSARFADERVERWHTIAFEQTGDGVRVETGDAEACEFVIVAGEPIGEPVVQHGPFVMNTRDEINQAMRDYRAAANGFERRVGFVSGISGR